MAPRHQQGKEQPLALEYRDATGYSAWRKGDDLIDALPYNDIIPPNVKAQIDAMLKEECQRSTKSVADYLRELPAVPASTFGGHEALQKEFERVSARLPMPPLDKVRYQVNPPIPTRRNDPIAWKAALDNAGSQLEHQYLRILNLELLLKQGDKVWRAQNQLDESLFKSFEAQTAATRKEIDNVNRERKLQQAAAGTELTKLGVRYHQLMRKNFEIDSACNKLEDQVYALQEQQATRRALAEEQLQAAKLAEQQQEQACLTSQQEPQPQPAAAQAGVRGAAAGGAGRPGAGL
ncbi:MAG: hypothetical protein WDW36_003167 [Sanguina aurantia]